MKTEKEQGEEREREKKPEEKELITSHSWQPSERVASDLSVITVAAGFLSPHNDTLQLQDCGGSGDENDDECGDGDDGHDDDVHQHVKDLGVVQIELSGHQVVHRGVGFRVNKFHHVRLREFEQD